MTRLFLLLCSFALLPASAQQLRFPSIISDHMVLQQQTDVLLWGRAAPGVRITVAPSWCRETFSAAADPRGRWELTVPTPAAGGPFRIEVTAGQESRTLHDVLVGEVWLCGGQSNMDVSFRGLQNQPVANAADEILDSNYPALRLFRVKRDYSLAPQEDCRGAWAVSSSESAETFSAVGFLFGRLLHTSERVPVGMILCAWGGSKARAWMSRDDVLRFAGIPIPDTTDLHHANVTPTALYNAMLLPIAGYTIRGCLFYQGEADVADPAGYRAQFPALVREWRRLWRREFPFFYVQLAPYGYPDLGWTPRGREAARFREVQQQCLADIPRSRMAATSDIGAPHTIHPADKQTLARRLFYLAAADCYGRKGFEPSSPAYCGMEIHGDSVALRFTHAPYGISSRGRPITGFEIAGADRTFHPARAWLRGRSTVWVRSDRVPEPVAVRYCFTNYYRANLYNNYGVVALPFRTDDWND